jgi:anti-sigma regulatory factor (Ser/Thr protein kinase)
VGDSVARLSGLTEEEEQQVAKQDEVRLAVPATPEFLRLARVTAAGLASRLGFTFDQVEDLRLAIDELCFGLTGSHGRSGTVHVRYLVHDDVLEVEGEGRFDDDHRQPELSELSEVILSALVDEHRLIADSTNPRFTMVKRRTAPD